MIHLDTGFLIRALVLGSPEYASLRDWLGRGEPLGISSIAWAEFLCGSLSSDAPAMVRRIVGDPIPFDAEQAERAAALFNNSGRRRGTLADCMVAAAALEADAALASNSADFRRLEGHGLRLVAGRG